MLIQNYIKNLTLKSGFWQAEEVEKISYPANGNNLCFEIEEDSFWFNIRNLFIRAAVKQYSIEGPVFDVGGGNGFVTDYLNNNGFECILVEPGIEGCINAKKRGIKDVINSFFDTRYFYPDSIPNIGIFDVLEHIENPGKFLNMINAILIKDGRLFITVPAYGFLWSAEDKDAGHYRRFRRKELSKLISDHGFNILFTSYFFSFLVFPIMFFRTLPSKLGFYKRNFQKVKSHHSLNLTNRLFINPIMKIELKRVKKRKSLLFGSSIILVANKI